MGSRLLLMSSTMVMPSAKMSDILQQDDKMRMLGWSMMSTFHSPSFLTLRMTPLKIFSPTTAFSPEGAIFP